MKRTPIIRPADASDLARLHAIVASYYETVATRPFDDDALAVFLLGTVTFPSQCCFVIGTPAYGLLCGVVAPHPRTGELVATKTAWWVKYRPRGAYHALLRAFETWAKAQGAHRIVMTSRWPDGLFTQPKDRAASLLGALGYVPLETVFEKEI